MVSNATRDVHDGQGDVSVGMKFADEDLLVLVEDEIARIGEFHIAHLDHLNRMLRTDRLELVAGLTRLDEQGLVSLLLAGPGLSYQDTVGLTKLGQDRALEFGVLQPGGRLDGFANELDEVACAIVDAVVMQEQQFAGAAIRAGDMRLRVRRDFPSVEPDAITDAIRAISGSFLLVSSDHYRSSLRGLLASRWAMNAVDVVDHVLRLVRAMQRGPRPLRSFSWCRLLDASGLPHRGRNLASLAISVTGLGRGLLPVDDDTILGRGWSLPNDIDLLLDRAPTGLALVHERAKEEAQQACSPAQAGSTRPTPAVQALQVTQGAGHESVEGFVFGHLVRALVEVAKKPARVVGKDEDDVTDLVELALGGLKERFDVTCNARVGHGVARGEAGVVDLSISDRTDGRIVVTGEAKRWDGQVWATEAIHQVFGASARTESFLLVLLYCQGDPPLDRCMAKTEQLVANFFVPDGERRLFASQRKPEDVTPPETRLIVRALRSVHVVDPEAPSTTRTIYTVLVDLADPAGKKARVTSPKVTKGRRGDGGS